MDLKRDTVKNALKEFIGAYGIPGHVDSAERLTEVFSIYHSKLSDSFTEDTFAKAAKRAWSRARGFPYVSDFHEFGKEPEKAENPLAGYVFPEPR